uniref:Uncharacterized protein n=1 Tax=Parascaris univalens TaxID=6257 RepID=A0A915C949_PARUN
NCAVVSFIDSFSMIRSHAHRDDAEAAGGCGRLRTRNNSSESSVHLASVPGSNDGDSLSAKADEGEIQVELADDAGSRTTLRGQILSAAHNNSPAFFNLPPSTHAAHTVSTYLAPSKSESDRNRLSPPSAYLAPGQDAGSTTSTYLAPQQPYRISTEIEPSKISSGSASVYLAPGQGPIGTTSAYLAPQQPYRISTEIEPTKIPSGSASVYLAPSQDTIGTTSTYLAPQQPNRISMEIEPSKISSGSASVYLAPGQGTSNTTSTYLAPQQPYRISTEIEPSKISSGSASVYLAPGQGASSTTSTYLAPQQPNRISTEVEPSKISSGAASVYLAPGQGASRTASTYLAPQQPNRISTEIEPSKISSGSASVYLAPSQGATSTTSVYFVPQKYSRHAAESAVPLTRSDATSVYLAPSQGAEGAKSTYLATQQHAIGNVENSFPADDLRQESGGAIGSKFGSGPKSSYLVPGKGSLTNTDSDFFCLGQRHFNKVSAFPRSLPKQGGPLPLSFHPASTKQLNKDAGLPSISQNDDSSTRTAVNILPISTQATSGAVPTSAPPADVKRQVSNMKHDNLKTPVHRTYNQSTKTCEPRKQPSATKNANSALNCGGDSRTGKAVNIPHNSGQSTSRVVSNTALAAGRKQQVSDPKHVRSVTRKLDSSTASIHLSTSSGTEGNRSRKQSSSIKNATLALSHQDVSSTRNATKILPPPTTVRAKVPSSTNLTGRPKQQANYTDHFHLSAQKDGTSRAPIHPKKKAAASTGNNLVRNVSLQNSGNANVFPNLISKHNAEHLLGKGKANVKKHSKSNHENNPSTKANITTIHAHTDTCDRNKKSPSNSKTVQH